MQRFLKFSYGTKFERSFGARRIFVVSSPTSGSTYSLTADELALAESFDGDTTPEEVLDRFRKERGTAPQLHQLTGFIEQLQAAGLLEYTDPPPAAAPSIRWKDLRELARTRHASSKASRDLAADGPSGPPVAQLEAQRPDRALPPGEPPNDGERQNPDRGLTPATDRLKRPMDPSPPRPSRGSDSYDSTSSGFAEEDSGHRSGQGPRIIFRLPVRWLLPIGRVFNLPLRNRLTVAVLVFLFFAALYGVWLNRSEVALDLARMIAPLTLAHTLLISMFSVNLISQLARAEEYHRQTGELPAFGVIFAFRLLPRFYADISGIVRFRHSADLRRLLLATLTSSMALIFLAALSWFFTRHGSNYLSLLSVGVGTISAVSLLLALNPMARREGYYLLALRLRTFDLREQALARLFGKTLPPRPGRGRILPRWVTLLYALLILAYYLALAYFLIAIVGSWMEQHWGGLGVLLFLALAGIAVSDPIHQARARSDRQQSHSRRRESAIIGRRRLRTPKVRPVLKLALAAAVLAWLGSLPYDYEPGGDFVILPNKRVDVRALVAGDIRSIHVTEGMTVEANQLLAKMSDDEERTNIAVSGSTIAQLEAKLRIARQGATQEDVALARQKVATAQTRYQFSRSRADRLEEVFERKAVSHQDYENALAQAEVDRERLNEAQKELASVLAGTRPEEIQSIEAEVAKERSQLDYHRQQLAYTELRAPLSGRIVSGSLKYAVGDYMDRGDLLATIENTEVVYAEVRIAESDVGEVSVGAPVRVKAWAYPNREFLGTVESIAPSAEAGEYGKVVRVMTRIPNHTGQLKTEMTGYAKIRAAERPAILAFTRMIVRFFGVELWSWLP